MNVPTAVKNDFNAAQSFFNVVLEAHVTAAALKFFGMETSCSVPTCNGFPPNHEELPIEDRKAYWDHVMDKFIAELVLCNLDDTTASLAEGTALKDDEEPSNCDGVFNYATGIMIHGLLAQDMHDASREGDGPRI